MQIAILGGTGHLGRRLAEGFLRAGHDVVLGSRDPAATRQKIADWAQFCEVRSHAQAVAEARTIVVAVPFEGVDATIGAVREHLPPQGVLVSAVVPLVAGHPTQIALPSEGSAAEHIAALVGGKVAVAAAFHTLSAAGETAGEAEDVLYCGNTAQARQQADELAQALGLRGVDCGPLRMARTLEQMTPLLIGINQRYHVHAAGIRITGLPR